MRRWHTTSCVIGLWLFVLALALMGCESTSYTTGRPPSALELAARETTIAQETRRAMENDTAATAEALANQRQATQQVLDAQGTSQAQEAQATRRAWELSATQEAAAVQSTANAEHAQATATAVAWAANLQSTRAAADAFALEATRQAIERQAERERITQPLRAWWGWALLVLSVVALALVGSQLLPVVKAQLGKVRVTNGATCRR